MVMMISVTVLAWRAGSIAKRCDQQPDPDGATTARQRRRGSGTPASPQKTGAHAADHHEFALGEIDAPLALKMIEKPSATSA